MEIYLVIGFGVLVPFGALALLFARRVVIARKGGTIDMSLRVSQRYPDRGWAPGLARFVGDDLRWYRIFSFSLRPRTVLNRHHLVVASRREPHQPELLALATDSVVMHCKTRDGAVDVAMNSSALAGFLSWLEAAPPSYR